MDRLIEIHDSTLAGIEPVGREVTLLFAPAYVHCSEGRPGFDPGSGWLQDIALVLHEAVVESWPSRLPCSLFDGALSVGGTRWDNAIPLPLASSGPVSLSAITADGETLVVHGMWAEAVPHGKSQSIESFPGAAGA